MLCAVIALIIPGVLNYKSVFDELCFMFVTSVMRRHG